MPVLFTSGYTENAIVHHGRLDEGVQLLSKPYSREDLARKMQRPCARPSPWCWWWRTTRWCAWPPWT